VAILELSKHSKLLVDEFLSMMHNNKPLKMTRDQENTIDMRFQTMG
jgi:hypothetical protein